VAHRARVPYRPPHVTPKPTATGVESATVVGPAGEEIHTDEFGRVRVQFPWDREGKLDDGSSCWIRVSQGWAGTGYGMMVIPRVGQEVLVGFLDGDPDQPIIVGRLFNNTTRVPYPLPKRKTVSTYKSDTSPHDGGFNEILFDDTKGAEYVYVQAQKDLWKRVKHDEKEETGNNRQIQIGDNQNTFVGAVDSTVAGVTHDVSVGHARIQKFDKKITITVGEVTITLDGPNISVVASGDMLYECLGTFTIQDTFQVVVASFTGEGEYTLTLTPGNGPAMRLASDATNKVAFCLTDTDDAWSAKQSGAPVEIVYPDQEDGGLGTVVMPNTLALVKGRPASEPAQRLLHWLADPKLEGRLAAGPSAQMPVRAEVPIPADGHVKRPGTDFRVMPVDWLEVGRNRDRWLDMLERLFRPAR
jgi:hypothetical protein